MMIGFFDIVNIFLGAINLMLAHEAYKSGNTRGMWINGLIGVFCIFAAAL
jgi:hypothetical protein